jgi:hypothetical protein
MVTSVARALPPWLSTAGQDLLVDPILPADLRVVREELEMIGHRVPPRPAIIQGHVRHQVADQFVSQAGEQAPQASAVLFIDSIVGVEPEDPVAGGVVDARIAGGGKIIAPGEVEDAGAETGGQLAGAVGGAGVHHDGLVHQVGRRPKAGR